MKEHGEKTRTQLENIENSKIEDHQLVVLVIYLQ